jgi:Uma2 family endonuclease
MQLYARHGIPCYWLVDPDTRTTEIHEPQRGVYELAARIPGDRSLCATPFPELTISPEALWA